MFDGVEVILGRTTSAMASFRNAAPRYARRQIACVRRDGFCKSDKVFIEGAIGISAAVPATDSPCCLAISLSAIPSRIPASRVKPLAQDIMRTCAEMARILSRRSN